MKAYPQFCTKTSRPTTNGVACAFCKSTNCLYSAKFIPKHLRKKKYISFERKQQYADIAVLLGLTSNPMIFKGEQLQAYIIKAVCAMYEQGATIKQISEKAKKSAMWAKHYLIAGQAINKYTGKRFG